MHGVSLSGTKLAEARPAPACDVAHLLDAIPHVLDSRTTIFDGSKRIKGNRKGIKV